MRYFTVLFFVFVVSLFSAQLNYKGDIDAKRLKEIQKNAIVIDIRTPVEWYQTGIVKGSKLITFFDEKGGYDMQAFMSEFAKYVKNQNDQVVIICRTGNRSVPVADFLARMGYKNIYNQKYGIAEWIQKGYPLGAPKW